MSWALTVPGARYRRRKSVLGHPWDLPGHWLSFYGFGAQLSLPQEKDPLGPFLTVSEDAG